MTYRYDDNRILKEKEICISCKTPMKLKAVVKDFDSWLGILFFQKTYLFFQCEKCKEVLRVQW